MEKEGMNGISLKNRRRKRIPFTTRVQWRRLQRIIISLETKILSQIGKNQEAGCSTAGK